MGLGKLADENDTSTPSLTALTDLVTTFLGNPFPTPYRHRPYMPNDSRCPRDGTSRSASHQISAFRPTPSRHTAVSLYSPPPIASGAPRAADGRRELPALQLYEILSRAQPADAFYTLTMTAEAVPDHPVHATHGVVDVAHCGASLARCLPACLPAFPPHLVGG